MSLSPMQFWQCFALLTVAPLFHTVIVYRMMDVVGVHDTSRCISGGCKGPLYLLLGVHVSAGIDKGGTMIRYTWEPQQQQRLPFLAMNTSSSNCAVHTYDKACSLDQRSFRLPNPLLRVLTEYVCNFHVGCRKLVLRIVFLLCTTSTVPNHLRAVLLF